MGFSAVNQINNIICIIIGVLNKFYINKKKQQQ